MTDRSHHFTNEKTEAQRLAKFCTSRSFNNEVKEKDLNPAFLNLNFHPDHYMAPYLDFYTACQPYPSLVPGHLHMAAQPIPGHTVSLISFTAVVLQFSVL